MQQIRRRAAGIAALAAITFILHAQNFAASALVIRVDPEIHLDTPSASLSFQLNNPGETLYSQPVAVTAWVRALPGQQIHLTALLQSLKGPSGDAQPASLTWTGAMSSATGGATAASCSAGGFSNNEPQQLIANWTQSGIARCAFTFALATNSSWPAGRYDGAVSFSLTAN